MEKIEFQAGIKFLTKQGIPPQIILEEITSVYENFCPGKTMVYKRDNLFKKGKDSIEDDPRLGTCLKKKQLAEMIGVSTTSLNILQGHLGMSKVCARWVPRMLTASPETANKNKVLCRIVTGDKTWVHHYEPESKRDFMQWHKKGTHPPKKFKVSPSARKVMATFCPDLPQSDYYLFPKMKKEPRGKKFSSDEETKSAISAYFDDKDKTFLFSKV
nr:uncharacterized protein LOC116770914 [Danaus plexippus plexippus]